jgi:hypothetical protein
MLDGIPEAKLIEWEQKLRVMPRSIQLKVLKELIADQYRNSLFDLCKGLLGYKDVNWETHGDIIRALESPTKRKLIVVPRGCLKSSIGVVAYSIWLLLRDPNQRILIDSELYTNSKNFLREIRHHLESDRFKIIFGTFKSDTWNEGEITIRQRTQAYKEASITAGGVGTTKVGQHYFSILADDYNSAANSNTPDACAKVFNHYRLNQSILEPDGTYVLIGTRYSQLDVIGQVLKNEVGLDSDGKLEQTGLILGG